MQLIVRPFSSILALFAIMVFSASACWLRLKPDPRITSSADSLPAKAHPVAHDPVDPIEPDSTMPLVKQDLMHPIEANSSIRLDLNQGGLGQDNNTKIIHNQENINTYNALQTPALGQQEEAHQQEERAQRQQAAMRAIEEWRREYERFRRREGVELPQLEALFQRAEAEQVRVAEQPQSMAWLRNNWSTRQWAGMFETMPFTQQMYPETYRLYQDMKKIYRDILWETQLQKWKALDQQAASRGEEAPERFKEWKSEDCAICLGEQKEEGFLIPCQSERRSRHVFHPSCIRKWFDRRSTPTLTCPVCPAEISPQIYE